MSRLLVIAEIEKDHLKKSTLCTLQAARALDAPIDLLLMGKNSKALAEKIATLQGVTRILVTEDKAYEHSIAENIAALVYKLAGDHNYTAILAPATSFGKDFMPRVAALLEVAQISDITKIIDSDTFIRPIYAGNALARVKSKDAIKIITVRPTAFMPTTEEKTTPAEIIHVQEHFSDPRVQFVSEEVTLSDRPTLETARVIVSGGRAFQNSENFHALLEPLAKKLNAAIGASRAAVDAGFAPNDYQVGQTGKVVAPELYFAIGISGAVQHLAGMKESKVIVAINKDGEAPIFQLADYALVGDLFEIIPELTRKLS